MSRPKLIGVDFDGTVVAHAFPDIGEPLPMAFEVLKALKEAGHVLILNTCREDQKRRKYLTEAVEFCRSHGVEFDGVNETPLQYEFRDIDSTNKEDWARRKVYATVYIDDRNLGGFLGWDKVKELLLDE